MPRTKKTASKKTATKKTATAKKTSRKSQPKKIGYEVERIAIADLKHHPQNYKTHPEDQLEHIKRSITDNGFYRNVVIAKDNTILAGHGVVMATEQLGYEDVPCVRLNIAPDHPKALKVLTGDNELGHLAESNDIELANILKTIADEDSLLGTGYDESMLANLVFVSRPGSEIKNQDEAAEWVGMPDYEASEDPPMMLITFPDNKTRKEFMESIGADKAKFLSKGRKLSLRWPLEYEREDPAALVFDDEE